jgi:glucan biosynthesis protein C
LWYLFGLMLYSVLAVALHRSDRRLDLIRQLDRFAGARSGRITVLMVAFVSACLLGAAQTVMLVTLPPNYIRSFGNIQLIAGYLPIFVLGFVLARSHKLRMHFVQTRNFGLAVCASMIAAYAATHFFGPLAPLAKYVQFTAAALCPPAAFLLVLRSALTVRRIPTLVKQVSGASYTIYILHYPITALINTRLAIGLEPHTAFVLSVIASGAASFAFHLLVVQRSPALGLLINGKLARRLHPLEMGAPAALNTSGERIPSVPLQSCSFIGGGPIRRGYGSQADTLYPIAGEMRRDLAQLIAQPSNAKSLAVHQ